MPRRMCRSRRRSPKQIKRLVVLLVSGCAVADRRDDRRGLRPTAHGDHARHRRCDSGGARSDRRTSACRAHTQAAHRRRLESRRRERHLVVHAQPRQRERRAVRHRDPGRAHRVHGSAGRHGPPGARPASADRRSAALALGALWIVGLHWWSLLLVAAFVAVGFAAVARAEQLEKTDSEPGEPEPPTGRGRQLSFGCAFFVSGAICEPSRLADVDAVLEVHPVAESLEAVDQHDLALRPDRDIGEIERSPRLSPRPSA